MENNDVSIRFIENVRSLVKGRAHEFERQCGVCKNYLYLSHSKQTRGISLATAMRMAQALGYTVEELASDDMKTRQQIALIDERITALKEQRDKLVK